VSVIEFAAGSTGAAIQRGVLCRDCGGGSAGAIYLDSPATTSATTYKTQMASDANVANAYCQFDTGETSTILLIEVTP
jgi:hypothetical protein